MKFDLWNEDLIETIASQIAGCQHDTTQRIRDMSRPSDDGFPPRAKCKDRTVEEIEKRGQRTLMLESGKCDRLGFKKGDGLRPARLVGQGCTLARRLRRLPDLDKTPSHIELIIGDMGHHHISAAVWRRLRIEWLHDHLGTKQAGAVNHGRPPVRGATGDTGARDKDQQQV